MDIERVQTFIRPSTDVPWFNDTWPSSHMEYIQTNYKDTGKLTASKNISPDGLVMTVTFIFHSQAAKDEFDTDQYLLSMADSRDAYNLQNDISKI